MNSQKMRHEAYKQLEKRFRATFEQVAAKYIRRLEEKAGQPLELSSSDVEYLFSNKDRLIIRDAEKRLEADKRAIDHYLTLI